METGKVQRRRNQVNFGSTMLLLLLLVSLHVQQIVANCFVFEGALVPGSDDDVKTYGVGS